MPHQPINQQPDERQENQKRAHEPELIGQPKIGVVNVFAAMYADGTAFSHKDLEDGHRTVLVFFRGRW